MRDTPRPEDDDLAAFDYLAPAADADASDLDALAFYAPQESDVPAVPDVPVVEDRPDEAEPEAVFSVTNPPGTVTVSAFIDGRVRHIDLASKVGSMTERHLADEIVVVARLATQDARSAQYEFMLDGMRRQGHDDVATRDFLSRDLDLPSPEEANTARVQVFAARYPSDVGDDD